MSAIAWPRAATSGEASLFLGTDSAPHAIADKESACGRACIIKASVTLQCYAQVFASRALTPLLEAR